MPAVSGTSEEVAPVHNLHDECLVMKRHRQNVVCGSLRENRHD